MSTNFKHYQKYQVYFFLYLAVICELLIIIVERDDAEAALLAKQARLLKMNAAVIKELLKNYPVVATESSNQLKIGEERSFVVGVKGLGDADRVTVPPTVYVRTSGGSESKITPTLVSGTANSSQYEFKWKGMSPGKYTFRVDAGTNRVDTVRMNGHRRVKIGSLDFDEIEITRVINNDPDLKGTPIAMFVDRSTNLTPAQFEIEVLPNPPLEQLGMKVRDLITAVGYNADLPINIEGTTPDRVVSMVPDRGSMTPPKSAYDTWTWNGSFDKPGSYTVKVSGRDNRGSAGLSSSNTSFNVVVKSPVVRTKQYYPFAGEMFEQNIAVHGLEANNDYSWKLTLDGAEVASGTGPVVRHKLSESDLGKTLAINAKYRGKPYMALADSLGKPLAFSYSVSSPQDRITNVSFSSGEVYPISNVFSFIAFSCGRCMGENYKPIMSNAIRIEVEDENGRDLLKDFNMTPQISNGKTAGTLVNFYLDGKIKGEVEVTIKITAGTATVTRKIIVTK